MQLDPLFLSRAFPSRMVPRAVLVLLLATVVAGVIVVGFGTTWPIAGDGGEYLDIGRGLAAGKGFVSPHGLWPTQPHTRPPLLPAILAIPLFLFPSANPAVVGHCVEVALVAGAAAAMLGLTWMLCGSVFWTCIAALVMVLYPVSIVLMLDLLGEPAALCALSVGMFLIFRGGSLIYAGAVVLGLVPLARPNYAILPITLALAAVLVFRRFEVWRLILNRTTVLACVLFSLPLSAWVVHNYFTLGRFPVISAAVEGETLYGSYNTLTANSLEYWGYWIAPELLPGEEPKPVVAKRMSSELELNDYYRAKGMEFIRNNWTLLPRLIVGRLTRAFVPVPWKPRLSSYFVFFFRALLDGAFLLSLRRARPAIHPLYKIFWLGVFLVSVITTILYWGNFRLIYPAEMLALPFMAVAAAGRRPKPARDTEV